MGKPLGLYSNSSPYEDEILDLPDEEYNKLNRCPNCGETSEQSIDMWPEMEYGYHGRKLIGDFFTRRCLSCGRFFSLSKNYEHSIITNASGDKK